MIGSTIGTAEEISHWLFEQPKGEQLYEIKERKRKRTLTQNAYYWSMLNQLGKALRIPTSELHFMMLKEHAPFEVVSVRSDIDVSGYFRYFEEIGTGFAGGREFTHYRVYKGSSNMDSAEFSRLIDGAREECEAQGIPVLTREEIARLRYIEGEG
ncbi:MAG: NinB protein [Bacteriophage sp.]|nr:MAG: NinB protein [Bacteriophage sp.]